MNEELEKILQKTIEEMGILGLVSGYVVVMEIVRDDGDRVAHGTVLLEMDDQGRVTTSGLLEEGRRIVDASFS